MNVAEPQLAAHLDLCWETYRRGLLVELASLIAPATELIHGADCLDVQSRANAEVEVNMLTVIVTMVTGSHPTSCLKVALDLANRVAEPTTGCDGLHRTGGFAVCVHAAMRAARLATAEARFQQALAAAEGLTAEGGEPGASLDDVYTVVGCAGLHLASAAAAGGDARTTLALLEHSETSAVQLGREHYVLGQYFGPAHVMAARSICLASLQRYQESLEVGHGVAGDLLIPLVHATLLRSMAEAGDRLELGSAGDVLRARAERVSPPLRRQFEPAPDSTSS